MKKSLQMIIVLVVVGIVSGTALVYMYKYAQPLIEENKKKAVQEAVFKVLPKAKTYEIIFVDNKQVYKVKDDKDQVIGYAFVASGNGYQGKIEIMVGIDRTFSQIKGIDILTSVETPGLGAKIQGKPFKEQFEDLKILPEITCIKNQAPDADNEIQAITGATVSSSSVVKILNKETAVLRKALLKTDNEIQAVNKHKAKSAD